MDTKKNNDKEYLQKCLHRQVKPLEPFGTPYLVQGHIRPYFSFNLILFSYLLTLILREFVTKTKATILK